MSESPTSNQWQDLFTPQEALRLSHAYWDRYVETMNNRLMDILARHVSDLLKNACTDEEKQWITFDVPWKISEEFEARISWLEAPVIEVALWEKVRSYPPRDSEQWLETYETVDPRVMTFLRSDNIRKVYDDTMERFRRVGWSVEIPDWYDEFGYPNKIIISAQDSTLNNPSK